jgi:hypothetical protein
MCWTALVRCPFSPVWRPSKEASLRYEFTRGLLVLLRHKRSRSASCSTRDQRRIPASVGNTPKGVIKMKFRHRVTRGTNRFRVRFSCSNHAKSVLIEFGAYGVS